MAEALEGALPGGYSYRRLRAADAEAYALLRTEMLRDAPVSFLGAPGEDPGTRPEVNRERFEHEFGRVLGVHDAEGALVASAALIRDEREKLRHKGLIVSVYTAPRARRRGFQRLLLEVLLEHARKTPGMDVVQLSVSAEAPGARALYESLGFRAWGQEPRALRIGGVDHDEIHMSIDVDADPPDGEVTEHR